MKKKHNRPRRLNVYDGNSQPRKIKTPEYKFLKQKPAQQKELSLDIRLNKYIANSGICSRREADKLIDSGNIKVNGKTVMELGLKIKPSDKVQYKGKVIKKEKFIYVLLNKPKDFITTTKDPQNRKTVIDLIKNHIDERIYPVGRLDRNTTGLLLLTNDGELSEILAHPSYNIKKVYEVILDNPLAEEDFIRIKSGMELEDGPVRVDDIAIISPDSKNIGLEIHSGRNRIVRRIFSELGYDVNRLDRVMYSFLTKKDLPRGTWRFLKEHEVVKLKYLGKGKHQKK
jgi:23S rRNA pseudouridine2605 synthase